MNKNKEIPLFWEQALHLFLVRRVGLGQESEGEDKWGGFYIIYLNAVLNQ
jgi:hypothetical protein